MEMGAAQQWRELQARCWLRRQGAFSGRMVRHIVGRFLQSLQEELLILQKVVVL